MTHKVLPLALLLLLGACDRIDDPILKGNGPTPPPSGEVQRKVLLEEYTGHKCPTCPEAHAVAQQLSDFYGDRLVIVSEHVSSLANPEPGNYITDFRTPEGNEYYSHWYTDIIPRGMVDRTLFNNNILLTKTDWNDAVGAELAKTADLKLSFDAFSYDSGTNGVSTTVTCTVLNPVDHALNLTVQLIEDHVIDWQYDAAVNPSDVPNYDHRHVLRGNLNGTWGEAITNAPSVVGDTISKTYNYILPANVVDPSHCVLVAYVYSTQGDDQYEVLQVEERKFTP
jgi:hypothetical protein